MTLHVAHYLTLDQIPLDCILECSAPGSVNDAVDFWRSELGFTVDRRRAERCLKGYGAWDDLAEASDETLSQRVLWLACGDFAEFLHYAEEAGIDPNNRPDDFDPPAGSDIFCLE